MSHEGCSSSAEEVNDNKNISEPRYIKNVWAVFAVGFLNGKCVTVSQQLKAESQGAAEALALQSWWMEYPKARQKPIVQVHGPYLLKVDVNSLGEHE